MTSTPPVICLGGPTGCGKTALAISLAQHLDAEIINADSRQVYAEFPIITAQPAAEERKAIPHHLYGYLNCSEKQSAVAWARLAQRKIAELHKQNRPAILVGGTGFYFKALLHGLAEIPEIPEEISGYFKNRLQQEDSTLLHVELYKIDPQFAAKIHPHDRQRIQRGLEVYTATGKTISWWHQQYGNAPVCKGQLFFINPQLNDLAPALGLRIDKMLAQGALEEAQKAKARFTEEHYPGWSGIGCREIFAYLEGRIDLAQCKSQWLHATRAYAKRQLTWFRGQKDAIAVTGADDILRQIWFRQSV